MRIFDITLNDLTQIFRDKRSLLFLIAMPVVFTMFMGFAYQSGSNDEPAEKRLYLGWVNQDTDSNLSQQLHSLLQSTASIELVDLEPDTAAEAVLSGEVNAALLIPPGFNQQVTGKSSQLVLVANPASEEGQSLFQVVRASATRLFSSIEIARLSAESVSAAGDESELESAFEAAVLAWSRTDNMALVKTEMAVTKEAGEWYGDNPYNQSSPGIIVMFAIFGLVTSGQILVQERKTRTLQRMRTTSLGAWQIIAGHMLAMFCVVFIQEATLILFGQLILGVDYGRELLAVLLVSIALGMWIASFGLLIGTLVKEDSQVVLFALLSMFIFSALGGLWFPLEVSGGAFAAIGKLMPSAWAMNGYQNILIRGQGLDSVIIPVLILMGYALGFFFLAVGRFRKSEL